MAGLRIHNALSINLWVVGMAAMLLGWLGLKERLSAADGGQTSTWPLADSAPLTGPDTDPLPAGAVVRLGRERLREGSGQALLAFSPDHKILASTRQRGGNAILELYGKHVLPNVFGQNSVENDVIHLWEVSTGKEIRRLEGPRQSFVSAMFFTSAGKELTLLGERFLSVLDVDTAKELHEYKGPWYPSRHARVIVSPDGKYAGWILEAKSPIHVSDASTGQEICQLQIQKYELPATFLDRAKRLVTVNIPDRIFRIRDIPAGNVVREFELPIPGMGGFGITFSADKKKMVAWQNTGRIYCWDVSTGGEIREIDTSRFRDTPTVALSPDGRTVATGSFDGMVRLFETATGVQIREIGAHTRRVGVLTFSADGKILASKESWDGAIHLWDVATGKKLSSGEGHQAGISSLSIAPDGKTVATIGGDNTIRFWDPATGQEVRRFPAFDGPIAFSPDGKSLATRNRALLLIDAATGKEVRTFAPADRFGPYKLAFSPDGSMLAGVAGRVNALWDVASGQVLYAIPGHEISALAFSGDGSTLAVSTGETIVLWGLQKPRGLVELRQFGPLSQARGWAQGFSSIAFSPNGKLLAAADGVNGSGLRMPAPRDGVIRLYAAATGQEWLVLRGHRRLVTCVQFSPNGKTLVSGGEDGTVRLWDVTDGKELHRFEGHRDAVTCVAFTPDGQNVISGSRDSTALIWDLRPFKGRGTSER